MEVWGPSAQKALGVGVLLLPHRRADGGGPAPQAALLSQTSGPAPPPASSRMGLDHLPNPTLVLGEPHRPAVLLPPSSPGWLPQITGPRKRVRAPPLGQALSDLSPGHGSPSPASPPLASFPDTPRTMACAGGHPDPLSLSLATPQVREANGILSDVPQGPAGLGRGPALFTYELWDLRCVSSQKHQRNPDTYSQSRSGQRGQGDLPVSRPGSPQGREGHRP